VIGANAVGTEIVVLAVVPVAEIEVAEVFDAEMKPELEDVPVEAVPHADLAVLKEQGRFVPGHVRADLANLVK
jgi:hypothetical protein